MTMWGEAPVGADRIRVEFEGDVHEETVSRGVYLAAWWNVPSRKESSARVSAFRIDGKWIPEMLPEARYE